MHFAKGMHSTAKNQLFHVTSKMVIKGRVL